MRGPVAFDWGGYTAAELVVSESEVPLSVDSRSHVAAAVRRRRGVRTPHRLIGVVLIGAWVLMPLMPLMPVAAILLSWLNGLS